MRTNKLVWAGVAMLVMLVIIVAINAANKPKAPTVGETVGVAPAVTTDHAALPKKVNVKEVTGDTVSESLKHVQVNYEVAEKEKQELKAENKILSERLSKVENRVGADAKGDDRVNVVAETVDDLKSALTSLTNQFSTQEKKLNTTRANGYDFSNEDLGIDGKTAKKNEQPLTMIVLPGYVSVKPLSQHSWFDESKRAVNNAKHNTEPLGLAPPGTINQNENTITSKNGKKKSTIKPVFTINGGATLMDATAMTAMIGRVPVNGRVQDPFAVKIILGKENLATNGYYIPGLHGIIFEGVATGNWNLGCVSVELITATFTFADGRIQHMPNQDKTEYQGKPAGTIDTQPFSSERSRGSSGESIGYISTPQGAPCIAGQRVTDSPQQLATLSVLGMAKSYFDAKAAAETTTITNSHFDVGSAVTGDKLKFANNETAGDAAQTVIDFYKSHSRDSIDAIVVNPGAAVSLHITQDLYGDYNTEGRKLAYARGGKYVLSALD